MPLPVTFATLTKSPPPQPLALFDQQFAALAVYTTIPCVAVGTNSIALAPTAASPAVPAYTIGMRFGFVAAGTSSGPVQAQLPTLTALNVYRTDGVTQATTGDVVNARYYELAYNPNLNSGAGGFFLLDWIGPSSNGNITALTALTSINGGALRGFSNLLINPQGNLYQRLGGSALTVNNDTYGHDRWYGLTQTSFVVAFNSPVDYANGVPFLLKLVQQQAAAQRFGYAQIIESVNCKYLRGQQVTLSGALFNTVSQPIRYAILEWTGTADAVTSNIVNDWTSSNYTAGNFFIGSGITVLGVGSTTPGVSTLAGITPLTVTVDGSANNLIVFFWTEGTAPLNFQLAFRAQLEQGAVASSFEFRPVGVEFPLCQRYYWKTFNQSIQPAQNAGINTGEEYILPPTGSGGAANITPSTIKFPQVMRTSSPTIVTYNPQAANNLIRNITRGADTGSNVVFGVSDRGMGITSTAAAGNQASDKQAVHITADAEL